MDNVITTESADKPAIVPTTPPTPETKPSSAPLIFALLALLIALAACAGIGGLYAWSKQQLATHLQQVQTINQQQTNATQQLTQQFVQLQNQLLEQQNSAANMQSSIQKLIQNQPGTNRVWSLAEINYLVSLANLQLHYNHSSANAILLLQEANQRLTHLVDPSLSSITQAINNNLTKLQALPELNLADLFTRLDKLNGSINLLEQVAPTQATPTVAIVTPETNMHLPWWKKIVNGVTNSIKQLVVINYHNKPLPQLLPPEQQLFLQQNLQLMLEQTQWAAMQGNQSIYNSSLETAKTWIKQYFIQDAPNTKAFMQEINSLQQINVQPKYPDLTPINNLINIATTGTPPATTK